MPTLDPILRIIGRVESTLLATTDAPKQGDEGAQSAWLEFDKGVADGLKGIQVGEEMLLITWLHQADRQTLCVHPRDDATRPFTGVFATRSQDRPNPLGLHRVTVFDVVGRKLRVAPLEAINGTPIVDLKPVLRDER